MARRQKKYYIKSDDFRLAIREAKEAGSPTVKLCKIFRLLISRYLSGPRYSGYDPDTISDMASAAMIKCLRNLDNYQPAKGSPFSYFTLATECCCKDFLSKHYRQRNLVRGLHSLPRTEWQGSLPVPAPLPQRRPPLVSGNGELGKTQPSVTAAQPTRYD